MENLASEPILSYTYANSPGYDTNIPASRMVHYIRGGRGRFAYLSHVLDTYDVEKKKKTMKQHQTYQTPKQRHRGIFFTPSESGRQSRRAILGEQVLQKKGSPDLDLQWLVSPKVLSPAKF